MRFSPIEAGLIRMAFDACAGVVVLLGLLRLYRWATPVASRPLWQPLVALALVACALTAAASILLTVSTPRGYP